MQVSVLKIPSKYPTTFGLWFLYNSISLFLGVCVFNTWTKIVCFLFVCFFFLFFQICYPCWMQMLVVFADRWTTLADSQEADFRLMQHNIWLVTPSSVIHHKNLAEIIHWLILGRKINKKDYLLRIWHQKNKIYIYIFIIYTSIHIHIYVYVCMYVFYSKIGQCYQCI